MLLWPLSPSQNISESFTCSSYHTRLKHEWRTCCAEINRQRQRERNPTERTLSEKPHSLTLMPRPGEAVKVVACPVTRTQLTLENTILCWKINGNTGVRRGVFLCCPNMHTLKCTSLFLDRITPGHVIWTQEKTNKQNKTKLTSCKNKLRVWKKYQAEVINGNWNLNVFLYGSHIFVMTTELQNNVPS